MAQLRREVGAPAPPEKPRETPADFKNDVLLPLLGLSLKPQAIYNLISGDARRKKAQYRYDDLQDNILWIRGKVGDDYFVKMEIPAERISEFLQFSMGLKPEIKSYIKAQNLSKVLQPPVLLSDLPFWAVLLKIETKLIIRFQLRDWARINLRQILLPGVGISRETVLN